MDELKKKQILSLIIDLVIYVLIFLAAISFFVNILPYHFEDGPGSETLLEYDYITPLAGAIFVLVLVRFFSLVILCSSIGMKLNKLEFDTNRKNLLKYDTGVYLFSLSAIGILLTLNFSAHCCGMIDIIEMFVLFFLGFLFFLSFLFSILSYKKKNEKIKIIKK